MRSTVKYIKEVAPCPKCGTECKRHSLDTNRIVQDACESGRHLIRVIVSKHLCRSCNKFFSVMADIAEPYSRFTKRTMALAIDMIDRGLAFYQAAYCMRIDWNVKVGASTIHDWVSERHVTKERHNGEAS